MRIAKKITAAALIIILSVFFMLLWNNFYREAFLYDDNRNQWFPVMEKAYEQLFSEGTLPSFTFYLAKGLPIAEQGYYSILNPFMLLSYIIAHTLPFGYSTITVYICMMAALGNVFIYEICRFFGLDVRVSALVTAAFFSCSTFLAFYYWYYIYNNVLFIPLLIYVFLKLHGTKAEYFACGAVLAAELFCGNVQYTCYHYMFYCIVCLVMIVTGQKNSIKVMISNIAVGLLLSSPMFLLLFGASSDFGGSEFMHDPLHMIGIIVNTVVPDGILMSLGLSPKIFSSNVMGRADGFLFYTAACTVPVLICAVSKLCSIRKELPKGNTDEKLRCVGKMASNWFGELKGDFVRAAVVGICCGLIIFLNTCDGNILAVILSVLPVINRFRYLFKAFFIVVPALAAVLAVCLKNARGRTRTAALVTCVGFTVLGMVNNYFVSNEVRELYFCDGSENMEDDAAELKRYIDNAGMDLKNYRSVCFFGQSRTTAEKFDYAKCNIRNFPAYTETFSLSAYEIAFDDNVLEQFDKIYDPEELHTVYANGGVIPYFYENCIECPEEVEEQLINNGIRYVLVREKADYPVGENEHIKKQIYEDTLLGREFEELLDSMEHISVEASMPFSEGYRLIVLSGVDPICTDSEGRTVQLSDDRMDLLSVVPSGAEGYTFQFAYNDRLYSYHEDDNGNITPLELRENEYGNTVVIADNIIGGRIFLAYRNRIFEVGIVFEAISAALLLAVTALSALKKPFCAEKHCG